MSFWKNRTVLVTGASGLLGGWMTTSLIGKGANVIALIRDHVPNSLFVRDNLADKVTIVRGALEDEKLLRRTIAEYDVQTVFHLAAQTIVGVAKVDPVGTLEANVRGTWNVLEAARHCKNVQVIVASSDKSYGDSPNLPYLETHPLNGQYPYDVSKSCADLITQMYARTYGLPTAITRCGNLFGGGDLNFSRSIPGLILATLRNERFEIRSDGLYVRDFLYIEDAVDGYLLLAEKLAENPSFSGEAFNFSLGVKLTVLELVKQTLQIMGRQDLEPIILNQASSEIREQYMVADKASFLLNWSPKFGLTEGLKRTIAWYTSYYQNS